MSRFLIAVLCMMLLAACRDDAAPAAEPTLTATPSAEVATESSPATTATPPPTEAARPQTTEDASPPAGEPLPSIEEIYARVGESLRQPGMLYHATITTETDGASVSQRGTTELWIDADRDLAREERMGAVVIQQQTVTFDSTTIRFAGAEITRFRSPDERTEMGRATVCYGAAVAAATLLGCPGALEESTTTVELGNVDGQPAIVLVTSGTSRDSDGSWDFTERLYLDSDTMLPIVRETEETSSRRPAQTRTSYQHEFVAPDAVPADLFDPVTLSLAELTEIEPATQAYWFGKHAEPEGEFPPLVTSGGDMLDSTHASDIVRLFYRSVEPHYSVGGTLVTEIRMEQLPRDVWDADIEEMLHIYWADDECGEQINVELPNGRATIFLGYLDPFPPSSFGPSPPPSDAANCPTDQPHKRFEAVVYFAETVVYLNAPTESFYRSREGLEALIRLLQPFDPNELAAS